MNARSWPMPSLHHSTTPSLWCGTAAICAERVQEAVEYKKYHWLEDTKGRPHGLIGVRPAQAVTFVDNHDTGSTQQHWPFPPQHKLQGYAYILTHPGIPAVFWEDLFEGAAALADAIKTLLDVRRYAGITSVSPVIILSALPDQYIAQIEGGYGDVRVRLGPNVVMDGCEVYAEDGWELALSDPNASVWVRALDYL